MKRNSRLQWKHALPALLLLVLTVALLARRSSNSWTGVMLKNAGNNPQDFFAWATNSSSSYSFRYDPRAADEWLFHFGARLFATSMPPTLVNWPTN
jgi:hypothetical protein